MTSTTHTRTPIQSARIRVAAAQLGWSATDLWRAVKEPLGIKYPSIGAIFNGTRKEEVPSTWLQEIARSTGQDPNWLAGFEDASYRELTPEEIEQHTGGYVSLFSQPLPVAA